VSWFLHEFVSVAAAFEDAGFKSSGSVGHFAGGDLLEHQQEEFFQSRLLHQAARHLHPRRQDILAGAGETDLARLLAVQQGRGGRRRANQIVSQNRRPDFPMNHLGRLAANVPQVQGRFDTANIQLRIPAETIQLCDVLFGGLVRIDQRRDDVDRAGATTALDDVVADLAQLERLGNLRVGLFIHPRRALRSRPDDKVIVLAQPSTEIEHLRRKSECRR